MNIIPFRQGDMHGKRELAVEDAKSQLAKGTLNQAQQLLYELQVAVSNLPEVDMPLQHVFAPGACARTIFIPAGSYIVGKIHKHAHLNILSMGHVTVFTESGGAEDLMGPLTMVSPAGTKRAVRAHTDTVWTTVHLTNETDLAKIEDEVIAKTFEEYEQFRLQGETMKQIEVAA